MKRKQPRNTLGKLEGGISFGALLKTSCSISWPFSSSGGLWVSECPLPIPAFRQLSGSHKLLYIVEGGGGGDTNTKMSCYVWGLNKVTVSLRSVTVMNPQGL